MAEEFDKSQDATPFKLEEARKKGQVGKSTEFSSMSGLLFSLVAFCLLLPQLGDALKRSLVGWMSNAHLLALDPGLLMVYVVAYVKSLLTYVFPIIILGAIASIIGTLLHVGPVFSLHPMSPDLSRLNPAKGLEKIFSRRSLVEVLKLIVKLFVFASVSYIVWRNFAGLVLHAGNSPVDSVITNLRLVVFKLVLALLAVYVWFSLFDLWYSKREFARQMRMSMRDVRDEMKRREGNPEIKSKRRRVYTDLAKQFSSLANIKDADVIITNPTHVAVALKYRAKTMALPVVVAKGRGFFAYLIRRRAHRAGLLNKRIPILARKLQLESAVNSPIPLDCQQEVANIYKEVVRQPNCKVFQ